MSESEPSDHLDAATSPKISAATVEGNDAVCFTAGPEAAIIGVGTIHAFLATRRKSPQVAAGISLGALNAAALQRVYREIQCAAGASAEEQEAARWAWFRHYIQGFCDRPWRIVWDAMPDQSDFFADMIPIRDASVPHHLQADEAEARRRQYLLVKLGRWLASLPISVSLVVGILVNYVRLVERYPMTQRLISLGALIAHILSLSTRLIVHICLSPQFFPEHKFHDAARDSSGVSARARCRVPLLRWINLGTLVSLVTLLPAGALVACVLGPPDVWEAVKTPALVVVAILVVMAATAGIRQRIATWRIAQAIGNSRAPFAAALAFTVVNTLLCLLALGGFGGAFYVSAARHQSPDTWLVWGIAGGITTLLLGLLALPFVVVPQTRHWLIERGFLPEMPRPLFDWPLFVFLSGHVLCVLGFLGIGGYLVTHILEPSRFLRAERFVLAATRLFLIAVLPLLPAIVPVLLWRRMRTFARARSGLRKAVALALSYLMSSGLFALGIIVCRHRIGLFHEVVAEAWDRQPALGSLFTVSAYALTSTLLVMIAILTQPVLRRLVFDRLLEHVGLQNSLVHDLYLRLKLLQLFDDNCMAHNTLANPPEAVLGDDPLPVVIVAASLQTLYDGREPKLAYQLWAKSGTPLLHALRAALAVPPFFSPVRITGAQLSWWLNKNVQPVPPNGRDPASIDLVDGSVVRQNPLPALFSFIRNTPRAAAMAQNNDWQHPAVHVVYGVPIEGRAGAPAFRNTIVDVGLVSLRLAQRRDTQLEVLQTNVISRLESALHGTSIDRGRVTHAIYADEIAPRTDLSVEDKLNPTAEEILQGVALGCRRSLETLYRHDLRRTRLLSDEGTVPCPNFLVSIGRLPERRTPGLPEVCGRCTGQLRIPMSDAPATSSVSVKQDLGTPSVLSRAHPQLTGEQARIVFVASGGVFRGAFHIGMLAALHAGRIKPDLVVGSSVGTLMGGALAAMFANKDPSVLAIMVETFLRVDEAVALTAALKRTARELGIRGRAIHLSPRQVRRMLQRGARSDASFATTGAPAALIDALSDLLMIPHRETAAIMADIIAGRGARAALRLADQLRTETIPRLDIERALLGTSLLENVVFRVLTDGTTAYRLRRQPFQQSGIAFYGTATDLGRQQSVVLGGHGRYPGAPYDFIEATLASSAFPAVFAPRLESDIFPGRGRADVFLSDGGMFDNLPFLPALEILSGAQLGHRLTTAAGQSSDDLLRRRLDRPDLFIAGALDFVPEYDDGARGSFTTLAAIKKRASSLQHNSKIRSFELASKRIYDQLLRLQAQGPLAVGGEEARFVDSLVNAAVLPVFPTSAQHLNGTFAFCRSTGLDRKRVCTSIADGCYQTFRALATRQSMARRASAEALRGTPDLLAAKAVHELVATSRMPRIDYATEAPLTAGVCPYFTLSDAPFKCPFADASIAPGRTAAHMAGVYRACTRDVAHARALG